MLYTGKAHVIYTSICQSLFPWNTAESFSVQQLRILPYAKLILTQSISENTSHLSCTKETE